MARPGKAGGATRGADCLGEDWHGKAGTECLGKVSHSKAGGAGIG